MNPDFRDLFAALNSSGVEYLVVGGHALAFHDRPRFTRDLDVWVRPGPENAARVVNALAAFGVPPREVDERRLTQPFIIFKIGEGVDRIDLLTGIDGVTFDEAWPARSAATYGGQPVPVISRAHLIANKRAVGRPQDLVDVEQLEAGF